MAFFRIGVTLAFLNAMTRCYGDIDKADDEGDGKGLK